MRDGSYDKEDAGTSIRRQQTIRFSSPGPASQPRKDLSVYEGPSFTV
jgi:hypothetical protein